MSESSVSYFDILMESAAAAAAAAAVGHDVMMSEDKKMCRRLLRGDVKSKT